MKLFASLLAASVLCISAVGCNGPHSEDRNAPMLRVVANHGTIMTGETTRVTATTVNMVGATSIDWSVSPSTASVTPDRSDGMVAIFAANEPGTYEVKATAKLPDGNWKTAFTNITVNGARRAK